LKSPTTVGYKTTIRDSDGWIRSLELYLLLLFIAVYSCINYRWANQALD
jgi:hypothetical protein